MDFTKPNEFADCVIECIDGCVYTTKHYLAACGMLPLASGFKGPKEAVAILLFLAASDARIRLWWDSPVAGNHLAALLLARTLRAQYVINSMLSDVCVTDDRLALEYAKVFGYLRSSGLASLMNRGCVSVPHEVFVNNPDNMRLLPRFVLKSGGDTKPLLQLACGAATAATVSHILEAIRVSSLSTVEKRELLITAIRAARNAKKPRA